MNRVLKRTDHNSDDDMPLEDQLRLTAVENPCLTTDEIVVLTNAQHAPSNGQRSRAGQPNG